MEPSTPGRADLATLGLTYFAVGVTVTVALVDRGVSTAIILTAALVVYSATSELAFLAVHDAGGGLAAGVLGGWLVSSRFGLLATSLNRRFGGSTLLRAAAALNAFDPNVALAVQQPDEPSVRRVYWRTTAALLVGWWTGTAAGLLLGNVVSDSARWGLDAVFPAALLAIIGGLLRRRDGLAAAIVGAVVCLSLVPVAPAGLPILASVVGVVIALAVERR